MKKHGLIGEEFFFLLGGLFFLWFSCPCTREFFSKYTYSLHALKKKMMNNKFFEDLGRDGTC